MIGELAQTARAHEARPDTDARRGLSTADARNRLATVGANELRRSRPPARWRGLVQQFSNPVILLMLGAAVVSGLLRQAADALAIAAIVIVNAIVAFLQESRAERALLALRSLTAPRATVMRDGRPVTIPATEVVPGDVLVLDAGAVVAADARLIEACELRVNEAPLTGESEPVDKSVGTTTDPAARVFLATSIISGTGRAMVTATGMATEVGAIATLLDTAEVGATPLQRRLAQVSGMLLVASLAIVMLVAIVGLARGVAPFDVFLSAVSLAVAAIPEGLPVIVTIALAVGVRRMAARHALVRRLPAVETLGCATVICTDKTGTLTTGVMTVRELWGPDPHRLLDAAAACCDAELEDSTELAILDEAQRRGIDRLAIERERPRRDVIPFDAARRFMSVRRADGLVYVKGAIEVVLGRCAEGTAGAAAAAAGLAAKGLRVLAVAVGDAGSEARLTLCGVIGIADPPRPEAIRAIAAARAAGIRTVMITGDHAITAHAIARELGIIEAGEPPDDRVHARATAADKLKIVRAWKARGAIVAMTGDGVNDAPALREAHVGIAMGKTGTEVTREVADIVLADDNFASIIAAVREGRGIFDNIRNALVYLLAGNLAELAVMLIAGIAGLPVPLLPLQLLWINLVTDGLPALALVMEPPANDVMSRPPRATDAPILGRHEWRFIVVAGVLETLVTLGVFVWALHARDLAEARALAFAVLVFSELFKAFAVRSPTKVFWQVGAFSNVVLLVVVIASVLAQLAIFRTTALQDLFAIGNVSLADTALCLGAGLLPVTALELAKLVAGRFHHREHVRVRASEP